MAIKKYIPKNIEKKWQEKWRQSGIYQTEIGSKEKKKYILDMFPYPSAEGLHVGHFKIYTASDILARYFRFRGFNVLHPMGWDAFGLNAENFALKTGIYPKITTAKNISNIKKQMQMVGFSYDWQREVDTTDPNYYKWTQWIFLKLFEKGLAYEDEAPINWCPQDKTGLANEEVINGHCERCGTRVERREIRQWILKITDYADRLLDDLAGLEWPEFIKDLQKNWIGKSEGAVIRFDIEGKDYDIQTFTTRIDTLFGATALILAPEHPKIRDLISGQAKPQVENYIAAAKSKSDLERTELNKEKTGVFTGSYAINPANQERIPIWVADYVLGFYGTGAVMFVPAHDARDFEFAKKFNLEIKPVILPQREYVDKNAKPYYQKRTEIHRNLLKQIAQLASKNDKKLIIRGGWAVAIQTGQEFREFEDLDIYIYEEDLEWWRKEFQSLGFELKTLYPEGKNTKYYFQGIKPDTHLDVGVIKSDKDGKIVLLEFEESKTMENSFEEGYEKKNFENLEVWVPKKEIIYKGKKERDELRWKEQADFLMMGYEPYIGVGILVNSGQFDGMDNNEAKIAITQWLKTLNKADFQVQYKLRDWIFSRQRYWGEPIPLIHCDKCGIVAVPESDLPVLLPEVEKYQPTGTGESPLAAISDWVNTSCPKCGGSGKRETNTMPQWAGSCWYYLRFCDPKNDQRFVGEEEEKYFMPVDWYLGGAEHAVLHLLYARFWHKVLYDLELVSTNEPFQKLSSVGLVLAADGRKMSKSLGNVVTPDEIVQQYGADTLRVYEAFMGPFENTIAWDPTSINGSYHFLQRVWGLMEKISNEQLTINNKDKKMQAKTIKKVTEDIENIKFNTAVASLMEWLNYLSHKEAVSIGEYQTCLLLLAPFAPHMTEELWQNVILGTQSEAWRTPESNKDSGQARMTEKFWSIHQQAWPKIDPKYLEDETIKIVIQVNGKVRDTLTIDNEQLTINNKEQILELALTSEKVKKFLQGKEIKKTVYVPGKILSIVI